MIEEDIPLFEANQPKAKTHGLKLKKMACELRVKSMLGSRVVADSGSALMALKDGERTGARQAAIVVLKQQRKEGNLRNAGRSGAGGE